MNNQTNQFNQTPRQTNWRFVLIALLIGSLIGLGVFAYQYWQIREELLNQTEQVENLLEQIEQLEQQLTEATDETANWQIYRNEEYGYEVKYPGDWQALEGSGADFWPARKDSEEVEFFSKTKEEEMNALVITVPAIPTDSFDNAEQVKINNNNFYKFSHEFGGDSWLNIFYIVKDDLVYRIMFDEDNPNDKNFEEHYKIFNQILSTFKFIE